MKPERGSRLVGLVGLLVVVALMALALAVAAELCPSAAPTTIQAHLESL